MSSPPTSHQRIFASVSLCIAAIGQYAVVAFDMRRRVRELGIRMALGAAPSQILRAVFWESGRATTAGLTLGFALTILGSRGLSTVAFGVTATDPMTYAGVFGLLSIASFLACYLPARAASKVDPVHSLRCE